MDRAVAAELLGISPASPRRRVEAAFRARARVTHPDLYAPGSPEHADATRRMTALLDARAELLSPAPAPPAAPAGPGTRWADDPTLPQHADEGFLSAVEASRRERTRALTWGAFLLLASGVSFAIGAAEPTNDALPIWSPALALTGLVSLAIGWRADRRVRASGGR